MIRKPTKKLFLWRLETGPVAWILFSCFLVTYSLTGHNALAEESGGTSGGSVSPYYGSFSTEVPIAVPPYHGLEPSLKLSYSSSSGKSWLGKGWSFSGISFIERGLAGGGVPKYDASDSFFMDGMELIPCTIQGGTHCTKIQNYTRIEQDVEENKWYVWGTNGNKTTYEAVYNTPSGTFRWMLKTLEDPHGNMVTYNYWCDGNDSCYLDNIQYNGSEIRLYWETRPDIIIYANGSTIERTNYRLKTIDVNTGGQRVRAYAIKYHPGSSGTSPSLLASVQQFGSDAVLDASGEITAGTSLPPLEVQYQQGATGFEQEVTWGTFTQDVDEDPSGTGYVDVNGDGKADFVYRPTGTRELQVMLSTGDGFEDEQLWGTTAYDVSGSAFVELDGDGKADVLYWPEGTRDMQVMLSNGDSFGTETLWGTTTYDAAPNPIGPAFADLNGDGRQDLVYRRAWNPEIQVLLSNGEGFEPETTWGTLSNYECVSNSDSNTGPRAAFVDVNGDGKSDFVYRPNLSQKTKELWVMLSNGSGFEAETLWGTSTHDAAWNQPDGAFADLNGDGKTDFVYRRYTTPATNELWAMLSMGSGFTSDSLWGVGAYCSGGNIPTAFVDLNDDGMADLVYHRGLSHNEIRVVLSAGTGFGPDTVWESAPYNGSPWGFIDVSGDGKPDLVYRPTNTRDLNVLPSQHDANMLLSWVANGIGGTTTIEYTPSSSWSNTFMPQGLILQTASSLTTSDGRGNSSTTDYQYEGGLWSIEDRRFLGFRRVTAVIDPQGNYTETYYFQRNGSTSKPEYTYFRDNQGRIFSYSAYRYTENTQPPYTSLLTERWDFQCNLGDNHFRTLVQLAYDEYGNVIETYEHGDFDEDGDERTTIRGYYPNTDSYIVGLPAYENMFSGIGDGGELLQRTLFLYDDNTTYEAAPISGDMTQSKKWNDQTGGYVLVSMDYDSYGNLVSTIDERGFESTVTYDPIYHLYPVQECNALSQFWGQCSSRQWDFVMGLEKSNTDPNNATTEYSYDSLGRMLSVTYPDGGMTEFQYLDWGNPELQRIRERRADGTDDGLWMETYQDGLGRVYKTVKEGEFTQETIYSGSTGRVWKKSLVYGPGEEPRWIVRSYDGANRLRIVTNPDNTASEIVYANDDDGKPYQAFYDELRHLKIVWKDAYGNVVEIVEQNNGTNYHTNYECDPLGNLTRVVDNSLNEAIFTYDSLGRKTSSNDFDMGFWTYEYDDGGLSVTQTNARNETITYEYDELGRMTSKIWPDGQRTRWFYDEPGYGASLGRLTQVVYPSGSEKHFWDIMGREISTFQCVGTTCETVSQSFDVLGRTASVAYPDGEVVDYQYDSSSRLMSVSGYVNDMTWNSGGQLKSLHFSNGTTSQFDYNIYRLWLNSANVTNPNGMLYQASYTYDDAARVTSVGSTTNPLLNLNFAYDDLSRLTGISGAQSQTFTYDALGNMMSNSAVGSYNYLDPNHVHAVTVAGTQSYTYDANGNKISDGSSVLAWDYDDRLTSLTVNGETTTFAYDAGGERIQKLSPQTATKYFGRLVELVDGNLIKYYYAGSMLVAKQDDNGVYWYHTDHLGSTRFMTDSAGHIAKSYDYGGFGHTVQESGSVDNERGFTGHVSDETGLIYMGARYYDAQLGRFLSADSVVPDPDNPQALNRYCYVYNNPISNVDPTGNAPVVAAVITVASVVGSSAPVWVQATAWIGAGVSIAGYAAENSTLSTIGGVLLGFAGGYASPNGAGALKGWSSGLLRASVVGATSPSSPLDSGVKQAIGWAYTAYGIIEDYMRSAARENRYQVAPQGGSATSASAGNGPFTREYASNLREYILNRLKGTKDAERIAERIRQGKLGLMFLESSIYDQYFSRATTATYSHGGTMFIKIPTYFKDLNPISMVGNVVHEGKHYLNQRNIFLYVITRRGKKYDERLAYEAQRLWYIRNGESLPSYLKNSRAIIDHIKANY